MFGWFTKKPPAAPADPLAAWDGAIESLERQGREVRKSAATLLTVQRELRREIDRQGRRLEDLAARARDAGGDERAAAVLTRDQSGVEAALGTAKEALARAETDAALLADAAQGLARQLESLRQERSSARARMASGLAVSDALKARSLAFDRVLALDRARDEVERAHALAELYRDDSSQP